MSISREEIERLARLAHLDLGLGEGERLAADLAAILAYVDRIVPERALGRVPPDPDEGTPLREDEPSAPMVAGDAVAPAPERANDLFKVPPAFGGA